MSPLSEAKHFVKLHAKHMGFEAAYVEDVLDRVERFEGDSDGSWVEVWMAEANARAHAHEFEQASNLYNLARFPVADSATRKFAAQLAAVSGIEAMRRQGKGEPRTALVGDTPVPFLFAPGPSSKAPLLIVMGGIVSLKEQWTGFLSIGGKLDCAVAIADFPGVGENPLAYCREASALYGAIMNACEKECDASRTLVVAPSFGGHLALVHALSDCRIREIVTVGAPIRRFFLGASDGANMPEVTRLALEHTTAAAGPQLQPCLAGMALSTQELQALTIPVTYVASLRDEVIPSREWVDARLLNPRVRVFTFDDVHGSPNYLGFTRLIVLASVLRHVGRARFAGWLERVVGLAVRIRPIFHRFSFA